MAKPVQLLQGARAFARDQPRDNMAKGYLWDVVDYVPSIIDAELTGRGGWKWGSDPGPADWNAGILASFTGGEQLLSVTNSNVYQINPNPPYNTIGVRGPCPMSRQNPVQLLDQTVWPDPNGAQPPYNVTPTASTILPGSAPSATVATVWGSYVLLGGAPASADTVWFSPPNNVMAAWDANSFWRTANGITGLAALRGVILVFHAGSIERLRGTTPPYTGFTNTDLVLEPLFSQAGTTEPRSICYWNENVIFADEHGVHMTDGAVIRNLVQQGSISSYWRPLYSLKQGLSACVFLDYYLISLYRSDGTSVMLICDLNKRQWFRFSNVGCVSMFGSGGTIGMERIWGGMRGTNRLGRLGPMFFPTLDGSLIHDDDGDNVLPVFETPWFRLAEEGRKRVRFVYLSYDIRTGAVATLSDMPGRERPSDDELYPVQFAAGPKAVTNGMLEMGFITSPQQASYVVAGSFPSTSEYGRYRVPVGKFPYGIGFRVKQLLPSTVTRIFDIEVEAWAAERSRV